MLLMVTKLLLIKRVRFQVPLNTFLHFFERCGHSLKTLGSKRVGNNTQNLPQRWLGSDEVQQARFWCQFCFKRRRTEGPTAQPEDFKRVGGNVQKILRSIDIHTYQNYTAITHRFSKFLQFFLALLDFE